MAKLTEHNSNVANLMYHCGVAVSMNYEVGRSGAWPSWNHRENVQSRNAHA